MLRCLEMPDKVKKARVSEDTQNICFMMMDNHVKNMCDCASEKDLECLLASCEHWVDVIKYRMEKGGENWRKKRGL